MVRMPVRVPTELGSQGSQRHRIWRRMKNSAVNSPADPARRREGQMLGFEDGRESENYKYLQILREVHSTLLAVLPSPPVLPIATRSVNISLSE